MTRAFRASLCSSLWQWCLPVMACLSATASAQEPAAKNTNRPRLVAQLGHSGSVTSVAYSPDGKFILTGGYDETARLWDAATGKELRRFEAYFGAVNSVAYSPDGNTILTGSADARLWDAATGEELRRFPGYFGVSSVAYSPDGKFILTGNFGDSTARQWDAATGKELRRFEGHLARVFSVEYSPDGKSILTGSADKTARIWDASTGKELRRFEGHSNSVNSVAYSLDGKSILTGSADKTARIWDAFTGKELRRFKGHSNSVKSVAYSPDGKSILTGSGAQTAQLWDAETATELRRFSRHSYGDYSVAYSPDGKFVLTGGGDQTVRLWDAATGNEQRRFEGRSSRVDSVAYSPNGKSILTTGSDQIARLWDTTTGRERSRLEGHSGAIISDAYSQDGKFILTGSQDLTARLWDAATGKEVRRFGHSRWVGTVVYSPDGKYILTGSKDGTARIWDAATGKELRRFEGHSGMVHVAYSPDGKSILIGSGEKTVRLWDAATGKEMRRFEHSFSVYGARYSPDGKFILTSGKDNTAQLLDAATGKEVRRFEGHSSLVGSVTYSPSGKFILTGSYDGTARLWDAATGKELRRFKGHTNCVNVAYSPDERFILTGCPNSKTRVWDAATGHELCSLISFKDGSWAVTDPAGRFDGSNDGDVEGLHWVVGNEPIDLVQLKERYYEPGLLAKVLGFNKEPLRKVDAFVDPKLQPEVRLTAPTAERPKLIIRLTNRGGGIGRVVVKLNGKEMTADARGPAHDANAARLEIPFDFRRQPSLMPGKPNVIEVSAFNAEGYLSSRGARLVYEAPGESDRAPPELWAIVAGVSDYRGDAIDLKFAAKDADDFARALTVGGRRLFGTARVRLTLLTTGTQEAASQPTRARLIESLTAARQARPDDLLVVYLAGHGVNHGGQDGDFYFLTAEARSADLADPEVRAQTALSSRELTELIKQIPAAKRQVLILDTCASGRLVEKLTEKRDVPSSQIRALDRLKSRTGLHVLAGCASDSVSYEASRYGQGLLTYSLLLGMRGGALRDDEYLDVVPWFQFAADRVPELAKDIGGIQRPIISSPKGSSFDIGRLVGEDKAAIPLQAVRPLILRSNFQDDEELDDVLALAKQVDAAFRDAEARGPEAPLVFVDAKECPDALRVVGRYRREGRRVTVDVRLLDGKRKPLQFSVTESETKVSLLAEKIAAETLKTMESR